jgi:hypothetical protein
MNQRRFEELGEALVRRGVATRHARHAVRDLERRFDELVKDAQARGESLDSAHSEADRLLGTDQSLIDRIAARPATQAWSCRWPGLFFTLIPLLWYLAGVAATVVVAAYVGGWAHGRGIHPTPERWAAIEALCQRFLYWLLPVLVASVGAYRAYRYRRALRWPMTATVLVCTVAAFMKFSLTVSGSAPNEIGSLGAGFGASVDQLPGAVLRALITTLTVLVPLLFADRAGGRQTRVAAE